ncbi:hypothetical protein ACFWBF_24060 [Streptomyces sp. NPDC060028]|uniref:hypothetical protein n=1 Tax=Streptomyces sp. NPDC060028 TaxID=3347041 RepID=UPI0036D09112
MASGHFPCALDEHLMGKGTRPPAEGRVDCKKLSSKGLASYVQTDRSVDGKGHPVALLGIGEATWPTSARRPRWTPR